MFFILYFFIFFFGLSIGSFLNCLIYRIEKDKSFLKGRSFCPQCQHILAFQDLIPVLSFLILKGKCRYCGKKISLQYLLVEISTAILFLLIFNSVNLYLFGAKEIISLFYLWIITSCLIIIFVYDLKHYLIPDKVVYFGIFITFLYQFFLTRDPKNLIIQILSGFLPALFFFFIVLISKEKWMGWGDVWLVFLIGLFLGWPKILVSLFFAFFVGAVVGIFLIIFGKKTMKSAVPFGPFLITGAFFAFFFGEKIIDCYLNFFL